jgi:hypothetical protein
LLTDGETYRRLKAEVTQHQHGSWDTYARDVWDFLVSDPERRGVAADGVIEERDVPIG